MEQESWKNISDEYLKPEEKADFAATMPQMPEDFDQAAYAASWKDLGSRIEAALPLDPAGEAAQAFLAEWTVLLEPFARIATPAMMQGTTRMYENMDEWEGKADPGFSARVFQFIQAASAARPKI